MTEIEIMARRRNAFTSLCLQLNLLVNLDISVVCFSKYVGQNFQNDKINVSVGI